VRTGLSPYVRTGLSPWQNFVRTGLSPWQDRKASDLSAESGCSTRYSDLGLGLDLRSSRQLRKQAYVDKQDSRSKRVEMLQKQLDRISKDNTDLESQIQDLKQLTEEAKCMASGFAEGKSWLEMRW